MLTTLTSSGLFLAISISSALAIEPTGDWRVADGVADIRVAQCNGSMWGVVAWEKEPGGRDVNNPDVSKQNRPTLGMPILIDMGKKAGQEQWEGQVYNAKDGQSYSATITPIGNDQLEIKGCVLGFLCGGETWTRVASPVPSNPANSMAKSANTVAKSAKPPVLPKAGSPSNTASKAGQKQPAQAQPTDPIGDICLLPDVARLPH